MKIPCPAWLLPLVLLLGACGLLPDRSAGDAAEAMALLEQNRIAEARIAINRAIGERDDVADYHLIRAQIELAARSPEGAFVAFSDALALDATNRVALSGVSQMGLQIGRLDAALQAADRILTLDPNDQNALIVRGLIEFVRKRYKGALSYANRVLEINPNSEAGVILQIRANFLLGNLAEAQAALQQFEEQNGVTAGSARTRIEIARYQGDAETMGVAFEDLARLIPDDIPLKIDRANYFYKTGQVDRGTELALEVIGTEGLDPERVAETLSVVGEYQALPLLARRIASAGLTPPPVATIEIAHRFIEDGLLSEARALLAPLDQPDAEAMRARLALKSGDAAEAARLARAVTEDDADNCLALAVDAQVALDAGRTDQAVRLGQRAAAQCPQLPEAWVVTAMGFTAKEDLANARRVFRDASDALPQHTPITATYVNWLLENDAEREAVAAAKGLTRRAPALSSGWRLYLRVCRDANATCTEAAEEGLAAAERTFGIDLKPGELPPNGLFGRFAKR